MRSFVFYCYGWVCIVVGCWWLLFVFVCFLLGCRWFVVVVDFVVVGVGGRMFEFGFCVF